MDKAFYGGVFFLASPPPLRLFLLKSRPWRNQAGISLTAIYFYAASEVLDECAAFSQPPGARVLQIVPNFRSRSVGRPPGSLYRALSYCVTTTSYATAGKKFIVPTASIMHSQKQ